MPNAAKNSSNHEEVGVRRDGDAEEPGKEERTDQPANPFSSKQLAKHSSQKTHWDGGENVEAGWRKK